MEGNLFGYTENAEKRENKHDPMPPGVYVVEITEAEVKPSSNGNPCLYCTYVVNEPDQYRNKRVWDTFALHSDIGKARLLEMAIACGHPNPRKLTDTEEILHKTLKIRVKIEQKDNFDPRNRVSGYLEPKDAAPVGEAKAATTKPATTKKPW